MTNTCQIGRYSLRLLPKFWFLGTRLWDLSSLKMKTGDQWGFQCYRHLQSSRFGFERLLSSKDSFFSVVREESIETFTFSHLSIIVLAEPEFLSTRRICWRTPKLPNESVQESYSTRMLSNILMLLKQPNIPLQLGHSSRELRGVYFSIADLFIISESADFSLFQ
jgi:hypothetical protein